MIPDNFWAIVGELSAYTVFPALTTYIFMHFVTGYFGRLAATRRYLELINGPATAVDHLESRIQKSPIKLDGEPAVLLKARQDMIDAGITFEGTPLIETTGFGPAHTVMFKILKKKRDVCELYMAEPHLLTDYNKTHKTVKFELGQSMTELSNTKHTVLHATWHNMLQVITVYPPTKHRKNWYISVQKYDEEGNKNDLEKVYLNKGSTFVYGYDIEVEK